MMNFESLADQIYNQSKFIKLIDVLNKTQQEMRWTNHPKDFLRSSDCKTYVIETSRNIKFTEVDINQLTKNQSA